MSNYGTMLERIRYELPRSTPADDTRITLAIISAIEFYRHKSLQFNTDTATFTTTASEQAYGNITAEGAGAGYPDELVGINTFYAQNSSVWVPVEPVTIDQIRYEFTTTTQEGYAEQYAWYANLIYLQPIPHTAYTVRLDYVKDIGTPTASYSGGAWAFLNPSAATLAGSYTNAWFTDAEELIRTHAKVDLHENWFKDDRAASRLRRREDEVFSMLKSRTLKLRGRRIGVPYA